MLTVKKEWETSLEDFEAWSGGKDTLDYLRHIDGACDTVESELEAMFPDGVDETELNDFLWFEDETIAEWLGYDNFAAVMRAANGETEDEDEDEEEGEDDGTGLLIFEGKGATWGEWYAKHEYDIGVLEIHDKDGNEIDTENVPDTAVVIAWSVRAGEYDVNIGI